MSDSPSSPAPLRIGETTDHFRLLVDSVQDYAIFMLDREGIVSTWNPGAQRIKGYTAEEIIGRPFSVFYPEAEGSRGWPQEELRRAAQLGRFEDEGWRLRKDGTRFWANVVITALRDASGEINGFAKITRDLSDRRRNEELLRQSEERFRLLVDSVQDYAIFMLGAGGHIESWNAGAQALKGYAASEVIGRHFSTFYTVEDRAGGKPARLLERALREGRVQDEGWRVRRDGSVFWAAVTLTAVYDDEGHLRGVAKVTRDMTEQRRVAELEDSARRISQFLAILGHELRNPLAPIRNAVSLMRLDASLPPHLQKARDVIDRQLTHVTRLVDDLLDVGRITTGKIVLKRERLDWADVVQRSVEVSRPLMDARGHHLSLHGTMAGLAVYGDVTRLVQILQNLLTNAAKYTPDGGRIAIEVATQGDMLITAVSDNGRGIEPQAIETIFELFSQEAGGEPDGAGREEGLGIGLTLARSLAEQHGGTLRAQSAGRGQGSTFTLRLPQARAPQEVPHPGDEGRYGQRAGCPVLVIDDNKDSADTMAALITVLGHRARAVYDGETGVAAAREMDPGLILLDLNMPGKGGFDVLAELRALALARPPVIAAMTGYGQQADRVKTLDAGFDAHLTKPVEPEQLRDLLARATN